MYHNFVFAREIRYAYSCQLQVKNICKRSYIFKNDGWIQNCQTVRVVHFNKISYEDLKKPIVYSEELQPYTCWCMKPLIVIYSADLKQKHIFSDGQVQVTPAGTVQLDEKWKYFIMTKSDGSKVYCTSYAFYEKAIIKLKNSLNFSNILQQYRTKQFYIPKCLVLKSPKPYFKLQVNLIKIHEGLRHQSSRIFRQITQKSEKSLDNQTCQNSIKKSLIHSSRAGGFTLDRVQGYSSHKSPEHQIPIQTMLNYYVQASNEKMFGEKKYLSQNKFQILHVYNIFDSLYRTNYFFHLKISNNNIFTILAAILQEKQIIFTSVNQNSNLMLMGTLLEMLAPLKWEYMYVPHLPQSMIDVAEYSFMPYIVGIHRKLLHKVSKVGRVIVHVDNDYVDTDEEIIPLPEILKHVFIISMVRNQQLPYIQWEAQLRVKSLMLVSTLLAQAFTLRVNVRNEKQDQFYSYFFEKSAMYQSYRSDKSLGCVQMSELIWLPFQKKVQLVQKRFRQLIYQSMFPTICENDKEWATYYFAKLQKGRCSLRQNMQVQNIRESQIILRSSLHVPRLKPNRPQFLRKGLGSVQSTIRL